MLHSQSVVSYAAARKIRRKCGVLIRSADLDLLLLLLHLLTIGLLLSPIECLQLVMLASTSCRYAGFLLGEKPIEEPSVLSKFVLFQRNI